MILVSFFLEEKSFLDLITNIKFGEEEQGTMQQLEERTRHLEKRVENLEAIVENMEIRKEDDICDDKRQRRGENKQNSRGMRITLYR